MKRDMQALLQRAKSMGCTITLTGSGHFKVLVPGGGVVFAPQTPSDWRSLMNVRRDLRQAGLDI